MSSLPVLAAQNVHSDSFLSTIDVWVDANVAGVARRAVGRSAANLAVEASGQPRLRGSSLPPGRLEQRALKLHFASDVGYFGPMPTRVRRQGLALAQAQPCTL